MLFGSKNFFKLKQEIHKPRISIPEVHEMNEKGKKLALKCFSGECIHEEAIHVRKSVTCRDEVLYIPGTLYCTNLRTSFIPDQAPESEDYQSQILSSDNDIALPCIERIVAISSLPKIKVLTAHSTLKFIPEGLLIYCRDFRVIRFHFNDSGLEPQAFRITMAIAQAHQDCGRMTLYENAALQDVQNEQVRGKMHKEYPTMLFNSSLDWESELRRTGASNWRVSPINERFDMSTSLPKYLMVPSRLLDTELKRTFAHFSEGRIPRLSWHHPCGSDLLRVAGFQPDTDPEKEDIRTVEVMMLANHSVCMIVDTMDDMPSLPDLQLSYLKLRALCVNDLSLTVSDEKWFSTLESTRWLDYVRSCLKKTSEVSSLLVDRCRSVVLQESDDRDLNCLVASLVQVMLDPHSRTFSGFQSLVQKEWVAAGHPFQQRINLLKEADKEESPVFLLFLDCMWQLLQQFPTDFEFTEAYLIALHDSIYVPFFCTFLFNNQWEQGRRNQHKSFSQTYTPVNGWRNFITEQHLLKGMYPRTMQEESTYSPSIWEWSLHYSHQQQAQFKNPVYVSCNNHAVLNSHTILHTTDKLDPTPSGNISVYLLSKGLLSLQTQFLPWKNSSAFRKGSRRALSSESLVEQERVTSSKSGRSQPCSFKQQLLPFHMGPWIHLWHRCYLRCSSDIQVGICAPTVTSLAEELKLLQERMNYEFTIRNHTDSSRQDATAGARVPSCHPAEKSRWT
uniref:Myotubularin-related protein 11 n=1 Tax=Geotrypetes seraphini TaxID=260995 RepID=A0A6P8Q0E8_GEOSA|nr:myotubularin-related protein 11 [Geotrypetes seraphini]XP_033780508.1 myotubularin-related protein 11 [Geotrypetes seraphini]